MTSKNKNLGPLTFGLDIGIASVGWAVLGENRIIDLGVRCFDKAETADKGESLNLARRMARLLRRRLRRRAWRLTKLARLLKREGVIGDVGLFKKAPQKGAPATHPWQRRVEAIDRKLEAEEWARVLYHLCKHRGFHWMSKAEEKKADDDKEGGAVKKGLASTKRLMQEKNYRTAAEMVLAEFPDAQRNKRGDYSKALSRELLAEEVQHLFEQQRQFGNPHASKGLEYALIGDSDKKDKKKSGLFWEQKPALSGEALLKMLGKCTFEKSEYRAPKKSFTAERHVWLTRLVNLKIVVNGITRRLNDEERNVALPLPYSYDTDLTYKRLHDALVKKGLLPPSFTFVGLRANKKDKDPMKEALVKMPGWQELRKALQAAKLEAEWQKISVAALEGQPQPLDEIARILSVYKEDKEVERELGKMDLPGKDKLIAALLTTRFDKFSNLSLKALYGILPHMEAGMRYDEACVETGYHHSMPDYHDPKAKADYLPPFYTGREKGGRLKFNEDLDIPRNPVVLRALNQARKVVNALIHKHGQQPHEVHIEMARDLTKPLVGYPTKNGGYIEGRREIELAQNEYRDNNERDKARFKEIFGHEPKGAEFEKWRLYREQGGKCAYSLLPLAPTGDVAEIFHIGATEIDHALPYSRSYDDSKNNKILTLTKENRDKGNATPYEYFLRLDGGPDGERWRKFVAFVEATYPPSRNAKKTRLLRKNFGKEEAKEFKERNLNDTRYICRFFKNYVEHYLKLADDSEAKRCVVVSGQLTAFLRARWGLVKVRGDSDRHHALDAAVVAACSHGMVKRLSDYSRRKELEKVREGFIDMETGEIVNPAMLDRLEQHFPAPWPPFRQELLARLNEDNPAAMRAEIEHLGSYPPEALDELHPLFVSRAPQRRNSGAAHKETIYGERLIKQDNVEREIKTQKIAVSNLSLKDLGTLLDDELVDCKLIDPHRNKKLYVALQEWVKNHEEREKRAREIEKSAKEAKRELTSDEHADIERLRVLPTKPLPEFKTPEDREQWEKEYKGPRDKLGKPIPPVVRTVTMVIDKLSGIPIRGGVAKNDTMLRVDVFTKAGKFHLVPVYVHHTVTGLPNRAIVAFKDEGEWTLIDGSFQFCFSLHPNDFVRIQQKNKPAIQGYYASCHRGTGNLNLWAHDRSQQIGKDGAIEGVGVKTALSLEKFNVDVLGNIYPAPPEKRRDLA